MMPTPLSDAIEQLLREDTHANYDALLQVFLRSRLGVIVVGVPPGASGTMQTGPGVSCATVRHPDGRELVLACAELAVFVTRFERPFNAEVDAESLMNIAMHSPSCGGIFINSATHEQSVVIDRATIERLRSPAGTSPVPASKPWWRRW